MNFLKIAEGVAVALGALGVPLVTALVKRRRAREVRRWQETSLLLRGIQRIGKLTYATAIAYIKHEVNGEMDSALDGYNDYMDELSKYLADNAAKNCK